MEEAARQRDSRQKVETRIVTPQPSSPKAVYNQPSPSKDHPGQGLRHPSGSRLAHSALVCDSEEAVDRQAPHHSSEEASPTNTGSRQAPPTLETNKAIGLPLVRESLLEEDISAEAAEVILRSWRGGTRVGYDSYLRKWESFCLRHGCDQRHPSVSKVLDFLLQLYKTGLGHSALNCARSALSTIIIFPGNVPCGQHKRVCQFLQGVFNERPSLPRYTVTWDINLVLLYLEKVDTSSIKELSQKTVTLLALLTGQRLHTLHKLKRENLKFSVGVCSFYVDSLLKTTKPGRHRKAIVLKEFTDRPDLCIVDTLRHYVSRTDDACTDGALFISYVKPNKAVSRDTLSRWVSCSLRDSGVDITSFSPHSCRSASTSKMKAIGVPIDDVLHCGGWANAKTFAKFYDRPVNTSDNDANAGQALIKALPAK
ncbi:uncharacterized protein LOC135490622 [Lineus longissimus]|uniref:uncharacterized protein LOC135490622 n=1 Tax=Lineus longissimus TaxID=88925 RepID=UPI00315D0E87